MSEETQIGTVVHFFGKINVAAIDLSGTLSVGDTIHIKGATSDFNVKVDSMQMDNQSVQKAEAGQSVGIRVGEHARVHDAVFRVDS